MGIIDSDRVYAYFQENHGPVYRSTNGWYGGVCPYCQTKKLVFNPDNFMVKCWKNCFNSGYVVYFVKNYLGCTYSEAVEVINDQVPRLRLDKYMDTKPKAKVDMALPDGYNKILDGNTPMGRQARAYLKDRGFDLNYLDMIGVGYADDGDYFGYIIIPFKRDNQVVYFIGRDYRNRGDKYRYKNPPEDMFGVGKSEVLFNEEAFYLNDKVYLLEGWTDAASIGNNASSLQGKSLSPIQWAIITTSPVKEVVVISDVGAEKEALNIVEKLYKTKKTKLIKLTEFKDFGKDVNAIGARKVLSLEDRTPYITNLYDFQNEARSLNTRKQKLLI